MLTRLLCFAVFCCVFISCGCSKKSKGYKSKSPVLLEESFIMQGVCGKVLWLQGDFMPSPDDPSGPKAVPVKREIHVYELTNLRQVGQNKNFFKGFQTNLVAKGVSDAEGNFCISLKPGKYSVFSIEDEGAYANLFDGEGNIFPIEVKENQVTNIEFKIDYKATY